MPYTKTVWVNQSTPPINSTNLNKIENGIARAQATAEAAQAAVAATGIVPLDSFIGSTDDDKLTAAMSYCAARTYKPFIGLRNRAHTFSGARGTPYAGFGLVGGGRGWLNAEQGIKHCQVTTTVSNGPWLTTSGDTWNWYFEGINFIGGGTTTQFLRATLGNTLCAATFHNLTFQKYKGVFGNSSETCYTDLCTWSGPFQMLFPRDTQVNLGGADNREMWSHGMNIGGGSSGPLRGTGGSEFLMKFKGNSKATVGPIYLTADNGWRGIYCSGSQTSGYGQVFTGLVVEGRNCADECHGNLIRVEGGAVIFRDCNVNSGLAAPEGTGLKNANAIDDRGLIEVVGKDTQVVIDGLTVAHGMSVPNTTPILYADGRPGRVRVSIRNVMRARRAVPGGRSPTWGSRMPVIKQSVPGLIVESDSSVILG